MHLPNTVVTIGTFPIGIDFENLMQKKDSDEVKAYVQAMRERYADKKVLMGRDKLDYIKGVPHKLLAFEKFLKSYPEWRGKVPQSLCVFLANTGIQIGHLDSGHHRHKRPKAVGNASE